MSRVRKGWLIGGVLGLIGLGLILGAIRPYKHASGAQPIAAPDVEVVEVERKDVPIYGEWIGTLDGLVNADVRAEVTGYLLKQGYQEGAFVRQGDLLFQIAPAEFVGQALGQWRADACGLDRKSTRLNSSHVVTSRMPSSA